MLPGIRFLFAAVLFAVSLVIFGLGAAALLRSAHEEFASLPTRRMAPPAIFAQQQVEAQPTLSMLRVEAPAPTEIAPVATATPPVQDTPAVAPAPEVAKAATPEVIANLTLPATSPVTSSVETPALGETTKPETSKVEMPEAVTTVAVAPSAPAQAPAATAPEIGVTIPTPPMDAQALAEPQTTATLTEDDAQLTSSKIAVLGGPPVDTEPVPLPIAKPVIVPVKKVAKKPVAKKRRVAAARPVAVAPQPTDPFGQPLGR